MIHVTRLDTLRVCESVMNRNRHYQRGTRYQHHSVTMNSLLSFRRQLKIELYIRAYYSH